MASPKHYRSDTRTRLLKAGGEIFAQYGYRAATVRRIAKKAHANVASVNYYFSGKEGLYLAVMEHTFATAQSKYPAADPVSAGKGDASARLQAFVTVFLHRLLDEGRPAWHGRLMVREIADPSPVLDRVVNNMIRPFFEQLAAIIGELLGPGAGEEEIRLSAMSIMGQCLFYRNSRPVVSRLYQGNYDAGRIKEIAEHISAFSLRALLGGGSGAK